MEFPLEFPVKAMGLHTDSFKSLVLEIISVHVDTTDVLSVSDKQSRTGKYLSVTCTIMARSRHQLDAIYDALTQHPDVLTRL